MLKTTVNNIIKYQCCTNRTDRFHNESVEYSSCLEMVKCLFKVNDKNIRENEAGRLYFSHIVAVIFFYLGKPEYCVQGKARSCHKSLTNFIIRSYIEYILERPIKVKCNDKRNEKIKKK